MVISSILKEIQHPNIPQYYNAFLWGDKYYLISEYKKSSTNLKKELKRLVFFPEDQAKLIFNQLVSILKHCMKPLSNFHLNLSLESINFAENHEANDMKIIVILYKLFVLLCFRLIFLIW